MQYTRIINDELTDAWMNAHYKYDHEKVRQQYLKVAAMALACVERIERTGTCSYNHTRKDKQ